MLIITLIICSLLQVQHWWHKFASKKTTPQVTNAPPQFHLSDTEADLPDFVRHCPVAMRYFHLLGWIDWQNFPERDFRIASLHEPIPHAAFAAACLVKLNQGQHYMSQLREYLVEHPALVWLFGFRLVADSRRPWGFDAEASLPTTRHFTRLLRKMPNETLQYLLDETVRVLHTELQDQVDDFGQSISLDTKHILAWVKENNPKAYVSERYDKEKQPAGDPDCRLGCKRRHNQNLDVDQTPRSNPLPASAVSVGEYHWGYASGIVATKVSDWGEFVLAEYTQTLDRPDVSYFHPLMQATEQRLGYRPQYGAFDAAFDAFYVYEYFHREQADWQTAFAAVPFSQRNPKHKTFDEQGDPLCEAGLAMTCQYTFTCRTTLVEHERAHYVCPLKGDQKATCPIQHKKWAKGGCTHRLPTSIGARLRHQIDRDSPLYKAIYKQRTATERINSQALALGIERPRLRNRQAITNQNTLIYVLINLRAIRRVQQRQAQLEHPHAA